ncbi:hypothetical protein NKH77_41205 [Streptomyces sp. M19]
MSSGAISRRPKPGSRHRAWGGPGVGAPLAGPDRGGSGSPAAGVPGSPTGAGPRARPGCAGDASAVRPAAV